MKKLFGIFLAILAMSISLLCLTAFDENENIECVYVKTGGSGDGSSADSPLGSLAEAYKALSEGGEIVVIGSYRVPLNREGTTRAAFVEPYHSGKITVRGYDGKATLLFSGIYEYHLSGETEIKDIIISSGAYTGGINLCARGHHLTMGEGLTMHSTSQLSGEVGSKVYLMGGCMSGAEREEYLARDNHLTVKSGSYWFIGGFNRNINATSTGKAVIEIGGKVHVRFLIAGSTGTSSFVSPSGCDIYVIGDISISNQISMGNQNSDVTSFDTNLVIRDGKISFTGTYIDYNARKRLTSLDIYVNRDSASAVSTYTELFAGYGDREGSISDYCKNENGGHTYGGGVCSVCGVSKAAAECTEHSFTTEKKGTVINMTCEKCKETVKLTEKTSIERGIYTYKTENLRVQILSDGILRIEESAAGAFTDKNTLVVDNRGVFDGECVAYDEDAETVILSTPRFTVNIPKNGATAASVRVFDSKGKLIYDYFETDKHGFYASLPAPSATPDAFVLIDNGIIPAEGGLTYNGSKDASSGWTRTENTDIYVLIPLGDCAKLRKEFTELTGSTMLSDIKTLGSWYSKWTNYTAKEKLAMIAKYREKEIPLDMIVIDTEWKNTSVGGNGGSGVGYETNGELYPDMEGFLKDAEDAGVLVLFNDHTHKTDLLITNPAELKWQSEGITSLLDIGLDGWWYDRNWSYSIKSPYRDVLFSTIGQVLYYDTMEKYHAETKEGEYQQRVLMLSNVDWIKNGYISNDPSVIGHRYGLQWTGDIYGHALQLRREIEQMVLGGVNGASPYISSDLGGFRHNDTVTENNFLRWMQYGAFSPVFRVHSTLSAKNEHLPWSYGSDSEAIVKDFLDMRYHLMPYYYMLARENYENGMPLMRRLDFHYPEYAESTDNTQYLIGEDILVAPFWSTRGDGHNVVPASWLKDENGNAGLTAKYYNVQKGAPQSAYFVGTPAKTENVSNIDFNWDRSSPAPEVNADYFTARYTGTITPEYDCYIGTLADDGSRIFIDGKQWTNGFTVNQVKPFVNTAKKLEAGKTYEITVEYFELASHAVLYLVCDPAIGRNMSERDVFIPDGTWVNAFTGEEITGPKTVTVTGGTDVMPIYIRKGAAIPVSKVISPMQGADWSELSLNLYGLGESAFTLYEDDGETEAYLDGKYRKTDISVTEAAADIWRIDIGAGQGDLDTDSSVRTVKIRVHSDKPVTEARINGVNAEISFIEADAEALPFANTGASNISGIYEITASVNVGSSAEIFVTTQSLDALDTETVSDTTEPAKPEKENGNAAAIAGIAAGAGVAAAIGIIAAKGKKRKK
ncbi:MAG: DUF5110 domain-containing protein [Clostridia bacterium]|nr:DUF5110 domain-containing protein [Clostridia bacterium]